MTSAFFPCPVCQRIFASDRAVRIHFGHLHTGTAWPFEVKWIKPLKRRKT
jgi:hypothetical protein